LAGVPSQYSSRQATQEHGLAFIPFHEYWLPSLGGGAGNG